mgnify:CR=1 FL=1
MKPEINDLFKVMDIEDLPDFITTNYRFAPVKTRMGTYSLIPIPDSIYGFNDALREFSKGIYDNICIVPYLNGRFTTLELHDAFYCDPKEVPDRRDPLEIIENLKTFCMYV